MTKNLLAALQVSWLSILFGSLVTIFIVGIFVHSILEVKASRQESEAEMHRMILAKKLIISSQPGSINKKNTSSEISISPNKSLGIMEENAQLAADLKKYADIKGSVSVLRTKRNIMLSGQEEPALPALSTNFSDSQLLPKNIEWKNGNDTVGQSMASGNQSSAQNETAQSPLGKENSTSNVHSESTKKISTTEKLSSTNDRRTNIIVKHANDIVIRLRKHIDNPDEDNDNPDLEKLTRRTRTELIKDLDDNQPPLGISEDDGSIFNNEQDLPESLEKENSTNNEEIPYAPTENSNKTIMFSTVNKRTNINVKNANDVIILKGHNYPEYTNRTQAHDRKKMTMKKMTDDGGETGDDQSSLISSQNDKRPITDSEHFLLDRENCKSDDEVQHTGPTENANNTTKTITSVVNKCTSINVNTAKDIIINMKRLVYSDDSQKNTQNNNVGKRTKRNGTENKENADSQLSSHTLEDYEDPSITEEDEDVSPTNYYSEINDDEINNMTEKYDADVTLSPTTQEYTDDTIIKTTSLKKVFRRMNTEESKKSADSQTSATESEDDEDLVTTEENENNDTRTEIYYSDYTDYATTDSNETTNIKGIVKRENIKESRENATNPTFILSKDNKSLFTTEKKETDGTLTPTTQAYYAENTNVAVTETNETANIEETENSQFPFIESEDDSVTTKRGENDNTTQIYYPDYTDPALLEAYENVVKEQLSKRNIKDEEFKKVLSGLRMPLFILSQNINRPFTIIPEKNPAIVRLRREDSDSTERTPIEATNNTDKNVDAEDPKGSGNQTYFIEPEELQKPESTEPKNKRNITAKISNFLSNIANGTIEQFKKQMPVFQTVTTICNKTETKDAAAVVELYDDSISTVKQPIAIILNRFATLKLRQLEKRSSIVHSVSEAFEQRRSQKCPKCRCKNCTKQISTAYVVGEDLNPMDKLKVSELLKRIISSNKDSEANNKRLKRNCTLTTPCDECFCETSDTKETTTVFDNQVTKAALDSAKNTTFSVQNTETTSSDETPKTKDGEKDLEETTFFKKLAKAKLMRLKRHVPIYDVLGEVFDTSVARNKNEVEHGPDPNDYVMNLTKGAGPLIRKGRV